MMRSRGRMLEGPPLGGEANDECHLRMQLYRHRHASPLPPPLFSSSKANKKHARLQGARAPCPGKARPKHPQSAAGPPRCRSSAAASSAPAAGPQVVVVVDGSIQLQLQLHSGGSDDEIAPPSHPDGQASGALRRALLVARSVPLVATAAGDSLRNPHSKLRDGQASQAGEQQQ